MKYGIIFGLIAVLTYAAGMGLTWKTMSAENQAFVEQSIGDTARLLSGQMHSVFDGVVTEVKAHGDSQFRVFMAKKEREASQVPSAATADASVAQVETIDAHPEISDLSLWTKGQDGPPARVFHAMNAKYGYAVPDILTKFQSKEEEEKALVAPSFAGHVVIHGDFSVDSKGMVLVSAPIGNGMVNEVVSAHVQLAQFKKAFRGEGLVRAMLVDGEGRVLARGENNDLPGEMNGALIQAMRAGVAQSGQLVFPDAAGNTYFGGFQRVGVGQLAVLAGVPATEARSGLQTLARKATVFGAAAFLICFGIGFAIGRGRAVRAGLDPVAAVSAAAKEAHAASAPGSPSMGTATMLSIAAAEARADAQPVGDSVDRALLGEKRFVTVLHGSLRGLDQLLDTPNPEEAVEAINNYMTLAASRVRHCKGVFERFAGTSFIAIWGISARYDEPQIEADEGVNLAIQCALGLRQDFAQLNESRRVDGMKFLTFAMGVDCGYGLAGKIGPADSMVYTVVGSVHTCARSLDQLCTVACVDCLVSQPVWQKAEGRYIGEPLGEAKLSRDTIVTGYHGIWGYFDEKGQEVRIETPYSRFEGSLKEKMASDDGLSRIISIQPAVAEKAAVTRWIINNGSQIVGPFTAGEIASRLYVQEMDFDSECWAEGTGTSSQIGTAGLFSGSGDEGANLWVFDGQTIHGPLSIGFLTTALKRGAIPDSAYVCETSTVSGWKVIREWDVWVALTQAPPAVAEPVAAAQPVAEAPPAEMSLPFEAVPDPAKITAATEAEDRRKQAA